MSTCKYLKCKAECCRYVTVSLNAPKSKIDFDEIRWFLLHENVAVYKDHTDSWLVEFTTGCKALNPDQTCKVYATRPETCSQYSPENCTANCDTEPHKIRFDTPEQVDKFVAKRWKKKARPAAKAKKKTAGAKSKISK